jgi:putative ABC transport system permease protein
MGMKKRMVGLGLWMELVVVTAVCLVLGLGIGAIAAQPASDLMLEAQNAASEDADSSLPADGGAVMISSAGSTQGYAALPGTSLSSAGGLGFSQAEPLTSIDVSLDWLVLLQVAAAALALASIAGLLATLQITKYEPIKILMERN